MPPTLRTRWRFYSPKMPWNQIMKSGVINSKQRYLRKSNTLPVGTKMKQTAMQPRLQLYRRIGHRISVIEFLHVTINWVENPAQKASMLTTINL
jgi:hypothetical protein